MLIPATNSSWRGPLYTGLEEFMCVSSKVSSVNLDVNRWSGNYLRVVNVKKKYQLKNSFRTIRERCPRVPGWVLYREGGVRFACRGELGGLKLSRVR